MDDEQLPQQQDDFYKRLRAKITGFVGAGSPGAKEGWVEILLAAPDFFYLLCKLMSDPKVSASQKTMIAAMIAYFVSPIDLIPEAIVGPIGFLDDVGFAALAMNTALNKIDIETVRAHWLGREDVLQVTQKIVDIGGKLLGARIWNKLRRRTGR